MGLPFAVTDGGLGLRDVQRHECKIFVGVVVVLLHFAVVGVVVVGFVGVVGVAVVVVVVVVAVVAVFVTVFVVSAVTSSTARGPCGCTTQCFISYRPRWA